MIKNDAFVVAFQPPFMQHTPPRASLDYSHQMQTPAGWSPNNLPPLPANGGGVGRKAHKEMYAPKPSCSDDHSPPIAIDRLRCDQDDDIIVTSRIGTVWS